jgi:hypothetical protein
MSRISGAATIENDAYRVGEGDLAVRPRVELKRA